MCCASLQSWTFFNRKVKIPLKQTENRLVFVKAPWMTEQQREVNVSTWRNMGFLTNNNVFVRFGD